MLSKFSLAEVAASFQALLEKVEFSHLDGEPFDCNDGIEKLSNILESARSRNANVFLVGNGGSAAVVSHVLTDFINVAGLRARTLHEPSLATCMSNDYGYKNIFSQPLSQLADKGDVLIAVSSSGRSINILNAVECMKKIGGEVVTLSGFDKNNHLRRLGNLNIWLPSHNYGLVEIGHLFVLHLIADQYKSDQG